MKALTHAEAEKLLAQSRAGASELERKLAASVLLAARVFPFPTPTTTTTSSAARSAGGSTMFKKATKKKAKLKATLDGPAGSGKTYSALELAKQLGGRVALIDTEHGSASKYADRFDFDAVELEEFSIETYLRTIEGAKQDGYDVLIIDSLSHAWAGKGGALERVDRAAGGNKFSAWRDVTPLHNRLIDAIVAFPGHVICTMRTKTEYVVEENGKKVRKVGTAPVQRDNVEYEFDVVGDLALDGTLTITKTRCPDLSGSHGLLRREDIGLVAKKLKAWLSDGVEAPATPAPSPEAQPAQSSRPPASNTNAEPRRSQLTPVEQVEISIAEAQTREQLDKLVATITKLPRQEQLQVRQAFGRRMKEVSHAAPKR